METEQLNGEGGRYVYWGNLTGSSGLQRGKQTHLDSAIEPKGKLR